MSKSPVIWLIASLIFFALATNTPDHLLAQSNGADNLTPIYEIQGSGVASPLFNEWIDTAGLVTGVTDNGYYLQDIAGDGDEVTSDGIFVYTQRKPTVQVGDCLLVQRAFVDEYYDKTELSRTKPPVRVNWCNEAVIEPVRLPGGRLAIEPSERFERFEGMLVLIDDLAGMVQGPTKRFNNGEAEIAFLPDGLAVYVDGRRIFQHETQEKSALMFVSSALGPELPDLNWGDRIVFGPDEGPADGLVGVLDYNFGKYQFMPLSGQIVQGEQRVPGPDMAVDSIAHPAGEEDFTICTFNLLGMGRGSAQYKDKDEYAAHLHKRALAISERLGGCTIIGLQEAGEPIDVQNLADLLSEEFGLDYDATAIEGPGTNSFEFPLTNAFLTQSGRVTVLDATQRQGCSRLDYDVKYEAGVCEHGTYGLFNRPPLVADLAMDVGDDEPFNLTVIDNHWKSKGGDESVNVVRRQAQAEHVASLVQGKLDVDPAARVVVLGDLNDYYRSDPIEALRTGVEPTMVHAYDFLPDLSRYTYIFNGASQVLDHVLFTASLEDELAEVQPIRLNANFAYPSTLDANSVQHSSDHDPVLVRFRPGGSAWIGDNLSYPGIKVALMNEDGEPVATTKTDDLGDFRLWDVTPGEYFLELTPPPSVHINYGEIPLEVEVGKNSIPDVGVQHDGVELGTAVAVKTMTAFGESLAD